MIGEPGPGDLADRATVILLKLEHALAKDEKDGRVAKWLEELRFCLFNMPRVRSAELAELYQINREIWDYEDYLYEMSQRKNWQLTPEDQHEIVVRSLDCRRQNVWRSRIIAKLNGFDDKVLG